jgi:hypothetical protein
MSSKAPRTYCGVGVEADGSELADGVAVVLGEAVVEIEDN